MTPGLRKFALIVHLTVSVGWIGAVLAYIALDVTAVANQNIQLVRAAFLAMELTVWYVIVPLALAALLTGLVMSLGTPWGLFRHYWVIITLVLTILTTVIVLLETRTISYMAAVAASGADPRELPGSLPHSVGGLIVLLVITGAERIQAARPNPVRVAKARGRASKAGATERSLTVPASLPTEFSDRIFKGNQQIN